MATIGLIKAIDRYDPTRGAEFSTYATPTILGEIKRWFRDKGWAIRVPRRLQELRLSIARPPPELLPPKLGRSPHHRRAPPRPPAPPRKRCSRRSRRRPPTAPSRSTPPEPGDNAPSTIETIGKDDEALEGVENRETLARPLSGLPDRERRIIVLRFFRGRPSRRSPAKIGICRCTYPAARAHLDPTARGHVPLTGGITPDRRLASRALVAPQLRTPRRRRCAFRTCCCRR